VRFVLAGEALEPCPEAEILFGTQRTCALYASEQSSFASKIGEFMNASLVVAEPDTGCDPTWTNAEAVKGSVAVVNRGTCSFAVKATNAQAAGAIAMVVVNNQPGLFNMVGNFTSVSIPAMLITQVDGASLKEYAATMPTVTLKLGSGTVTKAASGMRQARVAALTSRILPWYSYCRRDTTPTSLVCCL
jgi:hypothetical protein